MDQQASPADNTPKSDNEYGPQDPRTKPGLASSSVILELLWWAGKQRQEAAQRQAAN